VIGRPSSLDARTESGLPREMAAWWGRYDVEPGAALRFRIGPRELWLERLPLELRLTHMEHADALDPTLVIADRCAPPRGGGLTAARFALAEGNGVLIEPRLSDRSVVVHTHEPFHVLADDEAVLYLTTPVWLALSAAPSGKLMTELPCHRPSDTWFGPSTREGELCYAGVTSARRSLEDLTMRPHRAVTQVRLQNRADTPLHLDRVALPAAALSLFAAEDHRLWTECVRITREADGTVRGVAIEGEPPPDAGEVIRIAPPRHEDDENPITRAFRALLG
jgi:hypothetical protein